MENMKEIPRFSHLLRSIFPSGKGEWEGAVNLAEVKAQRSQQPPPPSDDDTIEDSDILTFKRFVSNTSNEKPPPGALTSVF
jgi:hypothetical protein